VKRAGPKNIAASVQTRLVERSRELGVEHQLTLARFGGERLLYRLSKSEFADRFILKGAALLLLWLGEVIRPTKDVDLLGFGTRPPMPSRACSWRCALSMLQTTA
jgi:predicted nucleotidyltransferase component of viral defense system